MSFELKPVEHYKCEEIPGEVIREIKRWSASPSIAAWMIHDRLRNLNDSHVWIRTSEYAINAYETVLPEIPDSILPKQGKDRIFQAAYLAFQKKSAYGVAQRNRN